jgi:hypothetical protein
MATPLVRLVPGHNLDGTDHEYFVSYTAALPLRCTAYECLVHLDRELLTDGVTFRTDHRGLELMEHLEGSFVSFNPEHFLELNGAHSRS